MGKLFQLLNSVYPLSEGLSGPLLQILKIKELSKKEYLLHAGHVCRHVYFVEKGLIRCFYLKGDNEVCSLFMKEGDVIFYSESFYQQKSDESKQVAEDCTVYYIEFSELQFSCGNFPKFNFIGKECFSASK